MGQSKSKHRNKISKSLELQKQKLLENVINVEKENKEKEGKEAEGLKCEDGKEREDETTTKEIKNGKVRQIKDVSWPDPDPLAGDINIRVDDVTRMNENNVKRIFFVRSTGDIKHVLYLAKKESVNVSIRGTKHSMGGHTIAKYGFVIDTARLNRIKYDGESKTATVGSGCLWSDLVYHLNRHGMSPRTLQSYSTFSVGGSLSVNAHGITSDFCLHESVVSFILVKWDGSLVNCKHGGDGESGELFTLALGGYGMFGVIADVTIKVQPNAKLRMDMIQCNAEEFCSIYKVLLKDPKINVKLGRLDVTNGEDFQLFVFSKERNSDGNVMSNLSLTPRSMSRVNQVLYKWLLPSAKSLRSAIEKSAYQAMDWTDDNDLNQLIYESAEPLVKLYSPFHAIEDTFILQEYFIPIISLNAWVARAKPVITKQYNLVTLLNLTIRFTYQDTTTFLAYSQAEAGSFCFVLYFRIRKSHEADKELEGIHSQLTDITLNLDGTFYLPYRHHYSVAQIEKSYPKIKEFFNKKAQYDPYGIFSSAWSENYMKKINPVDVHTFSEQNSPNSKKLRAEEKSLNSKITNDFLPRVVKKEVDDCYGTIMNNFAMRTAFFEAFLTKIFNIEDKNMLESIIAKAVWNPSNADDNDIFRSIQSELMITDGIISQASKVWKSILQTGRQKQELLRETISIVSKLGRLGRLKGYISIGDSGKMVIPFLQSSIVKGKVWVVHDSLGDIPGALERGTENEVGEFVYIDYRNPVKINIPSDSADLVTLNQGLHHQPQDKVMPFLLEIHRVLRPGGLFIVREHDASPELYPILYLAHSVFNAVTGVTMQDEANEIRGFRSIMEWREIIEHSGFTDTFLYEMEKGDPTVDEMMCFVKGQFQYQKDIIDVEEPIEGNMPPQLIRNTSVIGVLPKEISSGLDALLTEGPNVLLELSRSAISNSKNIVELTLCKIKSMTSNLSSGQQYLVLQLLEKIFTPLLNMFELILPTLEGAKVNEANFELIPSEVIVLAKALIKKGKEGKASPQEMIAISFIMDVHRFITDFVREDSSDTNEEVNMISDQMLDKDEVNKQMSNLLKAHPYMVDVDGFVKTLGVNKRIEMMIKGTFDGGTLTSARLTQLILNHSDYQSWEELSGPLEEIIQNPETNVFSLDSIQDRSSPWWHVTMGFLGSTKVQFNSYVITFGSLAGFGQIIEMWKVAQKIRVHTSVNEMQVDSKRNTFNLSANNISMLKSALEVLRLESDKEAALDSVIRCLKLSGIINKKGKFAEYTWFKLAEWMQVEIIQIFGNYMHDRPWFQFPFQDMLKGYFSILQKETAIVYKKEGLGKALFSMSFLTDFIPGIVMSILFGQMMILAAPLKFGLSSNFTEQGAYSKKALQSQKENLIVIANKDRKISDWYELDENIGPVVNLVPGLYFVTVRSLGLLTPTLQKIALSFPDTQILRISDHDEVQVRVSIQNVDTTTDKNEKIEKQLVDALRQVHGDGVEVMFQYSLPTIGKAPPETVPLFISLCVKVEHLLGLIRTIQMMEKLELDQIYDFWT